jgi:hypothetical protein
MIASRFWLKSEKFSLPKTERGRSAGGELKKKNGVGGEVRREKRVKFEVWNPALEVWMSPTHPDGDVNWQFNI